MCMYSLNSVVLGCTCVIYCPQIRLGLLSYLEWGWFYIAYMGNSDVLFSLWSFWLCCTSFELTSHFRFSIDLSFLPQLSSVESSFGFALVSTLASTRVFRFRRGIYHVHHHLLLLYHPHHLLLCCTRSGQGICFTPVPPMDEGLAWVKVEPWPVNSACELVSDQLGIKLMSDSSLARALNRELTWAHFQEPGWAHGLGFC